MERICIILAGYFTRPYLDTPYDCIEKNGIVVYRPNHGLCFSLRSMRLVELIIEQCLSTSKNGWLSNSLLKRLANDSTFGLKLSILSAFQRSGRESEGGQALLATKYEQYLHGDINNFRYEARKLACFSEDDIEEMSSALLWPLKQQSSYNCIEIICSIAHHLDLRRVIGFDEVRIKANIEVFLNDYPKYLLDKLWDLSGQLLRITGDRDLVENRKDYSDIFYKISNNPTKIYALCQTVR